MDVHENAGTTRHGRMLMIGRLQAGWAVSAVADRPNWTILRLRAEIEAREGVCISRSQVSKALRKNFRWRRLRHTLKGRQIAARSTGSVCAYGFSNSRPLPATSFCSMAMPGSLDHKTRQLIVHAGKTKRSSDFVAHLERLDRLYGR